MCGGGGSKPKPPPPPPPPPPPNKRVSEAVKQARNDTRTAAKKAAGVQSTIRSGGRGILTAANIQQPGLLGQTTRG